MKVSDVLVLLCAFTLSSCLQNSGSSDQEEGRVPEEASTVGAVKPQAGSCSCGDPVGSLQNRLVSLKAGPSKHCDCRRSLKEVNIKRPQAWAWKSKPSRKRCKRKGDNGKIQIWGCRRKTIKPIIIPIPA
ncbi:uncharacterized protein LOC106704074 isoform X2 [Latimeria chalumnae]|uniref:uncharacterized protein LOC106704074 isoform X2 n=1 Tax=Latimeria chalumnae TaxID=7897 RepID=UPI0006D8DC3D|nr:PREDICTED: uncharacterized protein LOC106704074 isoform X2 [Latimeria chalumnae]|eukprot:XP_014345790.1 PREDICTED: uncharacterized protein LOC106704074 isoform X2 [Latimeria chalumnae]